MPIMTATAKHPTTKRQVKDLRIGNQFKLTKGARVFHHVKGLAEIKDRYIGYWVVTNEKCKQMMLKGTDEVIIAKAGMNIGAPMKDVKHADLTRVGDSQHSSECPVCNEGVITMRRSPSTGMLHNSDMCTLCGQVFWYTDLHNGQVYGPWLCMAYTRRCATF
jgi:hypothetical protein